jgi:hypothetical protein
MAPSDTPEEMSEEDTTALDLVKTTPPPHEETTQEPSCEEPQISLHALVGITTPQTLILVNYIKHRKVVVLINSGGTHNIIHRRTIKKTHCYVHVVQNF